MEETVKMGFASRAGCTAFTFFLLSGNVWAAPYCSRLQDAMAVSVAALQQELMVAAYMCNDIAAYNRFVLSHRGELQESDKALMDFFLQQNAQTAFDDYNLFKTELANVSSFRSVSDRQFCRRNNANFGIATDGGKPLAQLLTELPYPVATGSSSCMVYTSQSAPVANAAPRKWVRHRTWLGRLVDAIFH